MALSITGRGWSAQGYIANGFLLANSGQLIREICTIEIDGTYKSDGQTPVQVVSPYILKLLGANWSDKGFLPAKV